MFRAMVAEPGFYVMDEPESELSFAARMICDTATSTRHASATAATTHAPVRIRRGRSGPGCRRRNTGAVSLVRPWGIFLVEHSLTIIWPP